MLPTHTTKVRAKRIALHYFKGLHPFRRWKLVLSVAAPAISAGWILVLAARGDQTIYTSGPVSTAHAMFGTQCTQCHVASPTRADQARESGTGFWLRVSDTGCLKCHGGPIHHDTASFTLACASCHVEHEGHVELASMSDRHCLQCHADLQTKDRGETAFEREIRDFSTDHPEFAVIVKAENQTRRIRLNDAEQLKDNAQLKLNHEKHLKPGLQGLDDLKAKQGMAGLAERPDGLQLACSYCHRPDRQRAYMIPIHYQTHCQACHPLDFDSRLAETIVPHQEPLMVRAFVRQVYTSAFQKCEPLQKASGEGEIRTAEDLKTRCQQLGLVEAEVREEAPRGRRRGLVGRRGAKKEQRAERPRGRRRGLPGRRAEPKKPEGPPTPDQWVSAQMRKAERLLFGKQKCQFCHVFTRVPNELPKVAPTAVPVRWLTHSTFDHGVHRELACTECHNVRHSTTTTDVLLPSVVKCRECHRAPGGARSGCVECHLYHDKTRERDLNGPLSARELVMRVPRPVPATTPTRSGDLGRKEAR